jgi:hypothetical protein
MCIPHDNVPPVPIPVSVTAKKTSSPAERKRSPDKDSHSVASKISTGAGNNSRNTATVPFESGKDRYCKESQEGIKCNAITHRGCLCRNGTVEDTPFCYRHAAFGLNLPRVTRSDMKRMGGEQEEDEDDSIGSPGSSFVQDEKWAASDEPSHRTTDPPPSLMSRRMIPTDKSLFFCQHANKT